MRFVFETRAAANPQICWENFSEEVGSEEVGEVCASLVSNSDVSLMFVSRTGSAPSANRELKRLSSA